MRGGGSGAASLLISAAPSWLPGLAPRGDRGELRKREEVLKQGHRAGRAQSHPPARRELRPRPRPAACPGLSALCQGYFGAAGLPSSGPFRPGMSPAGSRGARAVPGSRGWRCCWGDAQRPRQGGSRARSNVSTSPSAAPEPGRACPPRGWDGNGNGNGDGNGWAGAGDEGWSQPSRARSELSLCRAEGEHTRARAVPGQGENPAPLRRPEQSWEQRGFVRRKASASPGPASDRTASHTTPAL